LPIATLELLKLKLIKLIKLKLSMKKTVQRIQSYKKIVKMAMS